MPFFPYRTRGFQGECEIIRDLSDPFVEKWIIRPAPMSIYDAVFLILLIFSAIAIYVYRHEICDYLERREYERINKIRANSVCTAGELVETPKRYEFYCSEKEGFFMEWNACEDSDAFEKKHPLLFKTADDIFPLIAAVLESDASKTSHIISCRPSGSWDSAFQVDIGHSVRLIFKDASVFQKFIDNVFHEAIEKNKLKTRIKNEH